MMRWVRRVPGMVLPAVLVAVLPAVLVAGCTESPAAGLPGTAAPTAAETPGPPSGAARIEGVLSDGGRPVAGVTVTLTAYADDACADLADALAGGRPSTGAERERLDACAREADRVMTDAGGRFVFDNLAPGRYSGAVSWDLGPNVSLGLGGPVSREVGAWTVAYMHARTIAGAPVNRAYARTRALRLAAGAGLTLDLAHVPPR